MQSLHSLGFRVVQDVVYNHTFASGPYSHNSVLDKIVPGYYHRRQEDGEICHSTCCNSKGQSLQSVQAGSHCWHVGAPHTRQT